MTVQFDEVYRQALQLSPEERQQLVETLLNPPTPPDAQAILSTLAAHVNDLRALGVQRLGLFGSFVHGEADPASDIDLLVTLDQPPSMRGFMGVKRYLEDLLGYPVDLVLADSLRKELRPAILAEVVYVEGL